MSTEKNSFDADSNRSIQEEAFNYDRILSHASKSPESYVLVRDPSPNGGYGWVIVFASFMLNLIGDGVSYTFGLFFQILLQHYGASQSQVALCGALLIAFCLGAGNGF